MKSLPLPLLEQDLKEKNIEESICPWKIFAQLPDQAEPLNQNCALVT